MWFGDHCSLQRSCSILGCLIIRDYAALQAKSISLTVLHYPVIQVLILSWSNPVLLQWYVWVPLNGGYFLAVHIVRDSKAELSQAWTLFSSWYHSCSALDYFVTFLCPLLLFVQRRWDGIYRIFKLSFSDTAAMLTCLSSGLQLFFFLLCFFYNVHILVAFSWICFFYACINS